MRSQVCGVFWYGGVCECRFPVDVKAAIVFYDRYI